MRRFARALAVAAVLAALLVLAGLFGPNLARQRVADAAARALHRDVAIGDLRLLPSWPPIVQASDVAVAGLGSAPRVRAQVAPSSLLAGRPVVDQVWLIRPSLVIEPDAQGRVSLIPPRAAGASTPAAGAEAAPTRSPTPSPRIVIEDGTVILRDKRIGPDMPLAVSGTRDGNAYDLALKGTIPAGTVLPALAGFVIAAHVASSQPVHAVLDGTWRGNAVQIVVDSGTPEAIASGGKLPISLAATAAGATLHARGVVGDIATRSGLDLGVSLHAADERKLADLFGWPHAAAGPASLDAHVSGGPADYALQGFTLHAPLGDIAGDVALALAPRPAMRGVLRSQRLDLDAILAALAPPPPTVPHGPAAPPPPPSRWLISDRPLPFGSLGRADAEVALSAAVLRFAGADYHDLTGHLVLQAGRLALDPFAAVLPGGGRLDATAHLDGDAAALTLHAPAVSLAPTLAALRLPDVASGSAALDADLHATGATPHALAASLDGTAALHLGDGAIDGEMFAVLLHAARLPIKLSAGQTRVSCAAVGFVARNGVLDVSPLVADADRLRIDGAGSVDLGQETLSLHLQPLLRSGIGLVIPVQVSGPWRAPKVTVGVGSELPASTACPAATPAPASAAAAPGRKHPKPIDMLRALLR